MPRKDEQIKKNVVDQLYWDDRIDASSINVNVDNGAVTLSGEVGTLGERSKAVSSVWEVEGVADLTDNLTVNHIPPASAPDDDDIRERVSNLILWDSALDEKGIDVSVSKGKVTLKGTVDAYWKKSFAEETVEHIPGMIDIINNLAVAPSKSIEDEILAQDVVNAIERDIHVKAEDITVKVNDGIVTLSGTVTGWPARQAAENDASFTAGVVDVKNNINVKT